MAVPSTRHLLRKPRTIKGNHNNSNNSLKSSNQRSFFALLLTFLVVLVASSYLHRPTLATSEINSIMSSPNLRSASNNANPVFSLLVTLTFSQDEYKQRFLKKIQPVADHVRMKEPSTLAYEVLLSDSNSNQVLVLERYTDKDNAYLNIHKSSEPFLQFRASLQQMQQDGHVEIDGSSYLDSGIGFVGDRRVVDDDSSNNNKATSGGATTTSS